MVILVIFLFILFIVGISVGFGYLIDPYETSKMIRDFFDKFRKYDIQDQMSFFQESTWVEKVINSCNTIRQLCIARQLIPLVCEKYNKKVQRVIISDTECRLRDIVRRQQLKVN